jgi:hypothetical protein
MTLAQAIRYVTKNWRPTMSAPGYWDRPAAAKLLNESRATLKELLEAKRKVKELGARLKSQAMKLERTVSNADPQRSP